MKRFKGLLGIAAAAMMLCSNTVFAGEARAADYVDTVDAVSTADLPDARYYKTGWEKRDGYWYFNVYRTWADGWTYIDNYWYHFDTDCKMSTGWKKLGNNWYYFGYSSIMRTGKHKLTWNGKTKWYTFSSDGRLLS